MDRIYKALAEINRRKIIFWLGRGELNVSQIVKKLDLSQATISNHLSILRKSKLVDFKVKGKERIYKLNSETINQFVKELNRLMPTTDTNLENEIIIRR
ncbi:MAG: metalloregulator ArsR/SmtB family transcription factor [Candidatus Shapirobacteria bacterium]|nr:metalloregulator ArsR/SmtB family transcription factor [Candidatus Shapirobacteria bacterium]